MAWRWVKLLLPAAGAWVEAGVVVGATAGLLVVGIAVAGAAVVWFAVGGEADPALFGVLGEVCAKAAPLASTRAAAVIASLISVPFYVQSGYPNEPAPPPCPSNASSTTHKRDQTCRNR